MQQSHRIVPQTNSIIAHHPRLLTQILMESNNNILNHHLKSFLVEVLETQELVPVVFQPPPLPSISNSQLMLRLMSPLAGNRQSVALPAKSAKAQSENQPQPSAWLPTRYQALSTLCANQKG